MTACPASITLTRRELANLAAVAGAQHRPQRRLSCVLDAGHTGLHIALAQRYRTPFAALDSWAYWRSSTRRLITDPLGEMCTATLGNRLPFPGFTADCGLPAHHGGSCKPPSSIPTPSQVGRTAADGKRPTSFTAQHAGQEANTASRHGRGLGHAGRP